MQRLKINQFYGAPTAIRLLLKYGDQWVQKYDRSTLKTLGTGAATVKTAFLCATLKEFFFILVFIHDLMVKHNSEVAEPNQLNTLPLSIL